MSNIEITILATLALCAGPVLFLRSFRDLMIRRLIQNTPTSAIRSMAMGLVEVSGAVAPRSAVTAPFTGRPCVFWDVDIAVPRRRSGWSIVHRNQSGQPFHLEDETGVALVYPKGARCRVHHTREEVCLGITLPECYASYMSEYDLRMRHLWRLGPLRFRERVLEEGQRVYVLGSAEPRSQAYTISAGDEVQATGTDGPARVPRHQGEAVAVIRRGRHESTFLISQDGERELLADMGARVLLQVVAGPLLTIVGLWLWILILSTGRVFR